MKSRIAIGTVLAASLLTLGVAAQAQGVSPYGDLDRDGIQNRHDRDRDGDGVPNRRDQFPDNWRRS